MTNVGDAYAATRLGRRIYVDRDDQRAEGLQRAEGDLNPGSARLWNLVLTMRDWDLVVDVGANYGEMVLGVELPRGAQVICFEPNPRVLPWLRRSLAEADLAIELREVAIGASDGHAEFVVDAVWSGRSGLLRTHRTDADHELTTIAVPVRTLDSQLVLDDRTSVCVKVDVEGAELDVLEGARDLLTSDRPWALMLEILHMDVYEKARLAHEFTMSVMDRRTGSLVVVPPATPRAVAQLLAAGWVHPQDAVLTARGPR